MWLSSTEHCGLREAVLCGSPLQFVLVCGGTGALLYQVRQCGANVATGAVCVLVVEGTCIEPTA